MSLPSLSRIGFLGVMTLLLLAAGCENEAAKGPATQPAMAECLPCKGHKIAIAADTPKSEYEGKTYYFCAPECKEKFDKEPAKFVKK